MLLTTMLASVALVANPGGDQTIDLTELSLDGASRRASARRVARHQRADAVR
jgi:hypothetical protein